MEQKKGFEVRIIVKVDGEVQQDVTTENCIVVAMREDKSRMRMVACNGVDRVLLELVTGLIGVEEEIEEKCPGIVKFGRLYKNVELPREREVVVDFSEPIEQANEEAAQ